MQDDFKKQVQKSLEKLRSDRDFLGLSNIWNREAIRHGYAGNFTWLGRPIIQVPQDIYAIQELIWEIKPDLIIETGIAHGGSLMMSASMLALLDYCEAASGSGTLMTGLSKRRVLGIDIDIREHNRRAIEAHPLYNLIHMIEGSSIDSKVISEVKEFSKDFKKILVFLDSNHTHNHVLEELRSYAPLVSVGSYCVVWDTGVEDLPEGFVIDRPWGKGDNPKTAVWKYLEEINQHTKQGDASIKFEIDKIIESKLAITASPDGFLCRVS
jgi:cephalosporin hydroxylase